MWSAIVFLWGVVADDVITCGELWQQGLVVEALKEKTNLCVQGTVRERHEFLFDTVFGSAV